MLLVEDGHREEDADGRDHGSDPLAAAVEAGDGGEADHRVAALVRLRARVRVRAWVWVWS